MLELSGVNVHYCKIHVLRDVTLRVETGEVAALAVFLASDDAQSITGAILPIDGGWTAH